MKLSLCIITGNIGAALMNRFLNQFKPHVDEIIVIRAIGAQEPDESLETARSRGCMVGEYVNTRPGSETWPHVDDFAAARNFAWSMASGDWVMWADTDDLISQESGQRLRALLAEHGEKFDCLITPYVVAEAGYQNNMRERVVRRDIAHWVQPVHECIAPIDPQQKWRTHTDLDVRIVHNPPVDVPRGRGGRNLRILRSLRTDEITSSLRYHLFAEFCVNGMIPEAAQAAEAYLLQPDAGRSERYEIALWMSMLSTDETTKANWAQLALSICPERREAYVLLADIRLNAGLIEEARAYHRAAGAQPLPEFAVWNLRNSMWGWKHVQQGARIARTEGNFAHADALELNHFIRSGGKISLLHATRGRAAQAVEARELWLTRAENPDAIEHIFACDPDDPDGPKLAAFRHIVQDPDGGPVGAWNLAATIAHGEVLVQVSDDMVPPHGWDRLILERLGDLQQPRVLRVSDGHRADGLIVLAIVTRAWMKQTGYLFHPAFFSMFSDNWLTEQATRAGAIVEAPDIIFEHRHPVFTGAAMHPTTAQSNRLLHYAEGRTIFRQLCAGKEPFTWRCVPGLSEDDSPAVLHERIIAQLRENPLCVEVGVAKGRGLACMAMLAEYRGGRAIGVDTFAGTSGESIDYPADMEALCRAHLEQCGVNPLLIVARSTETVKACQAQADYIFLDAAHDYDSICEDIAAWWPAVRPGGFLAGHDYTHAEGVRRAVDEAFPTAEKLGECWFIQKPLHS